MIFIHLLFVTSFVVTTTTAFIFPDIRALRTGGVQSTYKIAVIEDEEPYLFRNGSGYAAELLRLIGDWYATNNADNDTFPYNIVPVKTWNQLLEKASATHWKLAYGMLSSSLLKNDEPWKSMYASNPILHTELRLITSKRQRKHHHHHQLNNYNNVTKHPEKQSQHNVGIRIPDARGTTVVTLGDGSLDHLMRKSPKYKQNHRTVKSIEDGLAMVQQTPNVHFLMDAVAAQHITNPMDNELTTTCVKVKSMFPSGSGFFYYGFFGRNGAIIHFLNGALKRIRATHDHLIPTLNKKYFGHTAPCH